MSDTETYAPEEPRSFDATIERQPYEPPKETADSINAHEAADLVNQTRGEQNEVIKRHVRDPDDLNRVAPADVTLTKETAADALKSAREFEHNLEQESVDAQLAAKVDEFRGQPQQPEPPPQPDWGRRRFSPSTLIWTSRRLSWIVCLETCLPSGADPLFKLSTNNYSRRRRRLRRSSMSTFRGRRTMPSNTSRALPKRY